MAERWRTEQRRHLTDILRVERLEEDADGFENDITRLNSRISKLLTIGVTTMFSTFTAILLLVLNLIFALR